MTLRNLRKHPNLMQIDVAALCDVTQGLVSQWERGVAKPNRFVLPILCGTTYRVSREEYEAAWEATRTEQQQAVLDWITGGRLGVACLPTGTGLLRRRTRRA